MQWSRWRITAAGLMLLILLGLSAACGRSGLERSLDDSTLLLIASHQRLDTGDAIAAGGRAGLLARVQAGHSADGQSLNEIESLIRIRQQLHADQMLKVDQLYSGDQAARLKVSLEQEQQQKIESLLKAAERLKKSRARRRRGIFGFFRRIGRGIANVITRGLRTFGKVTRFVVTEFGPQLVKDMIMKRVQALNALIQGRFDLMWERVRGRLGGPLTEILRTVVDKAFVRERNRLMVRIGLRDAERVQAGGAQAAGQEEEQIEPYLSCDDLAWVDPYFEGVQGELIADGRNCQVKAAFEYRECLLEMAGAGQCKEQALASCNKVYESIPVNLPGGSGALQWAKVHGGAIDQQANLVIPPEGGSVSGRIYYQLYDSVMICTITETVSLTGTYEPETCSLSGRAEITILYEGMNCVSVCGSAPSSPASCPLTKSGAAVWEAELEDGKLVGAVGDESCDPHCFGFSASP